MPAVSIVIPCYGQGRHLAACVASVQAQTLPALEILIAAGTRADAEAARALRVDVRILEGLDRGVSDARNAGIEAARGDHVLPLDADDVLAPTFLERTAAMTRGETLAIVSTNLEEFDERHGYWDLPPYCRAHLLESNALCVASLFTKALWAAAGGYDLSLLGYEDWSFWIACSRHSPAVRHVPERLLRYRVRAESATAATGHHDRLKRAMLRVRHSDLYDAERIRRDLETIGGMPDDALHALERRLARFPENRALRFFRGVVRGYRGDLAGALEDYAPTPAAHPAPR